MARPQEFNTAEALHKAMEVFWHKGYEATSLSDLLEATGLSKSSLYSTFGGKHALFLAAFDAYRRQRATDMQRVLAQEPARPAIEAFFHLLLGDVDAPAPALGCMSINQAIEMAPHDPEIRERVLTDFRRIEEALLRIIQRGQHKGSLTSTRSPRELANLLALAYPGLQVMARAGYTRSDLDDRVRQLLTNLD
ncbi:TetR/AcrR family transcriptional regulator [Hymenobacter sp. BT730]|uniref:TetR/AcrR family transcriptional regulator n=1 Tax=Hymenobacter sp. BT730 TaxID=3063332 RepID=UPI0026E02B59|nr:TetR/AcrR family transcriptional regulator [Hymenobacter sp. BT730]